MNDVQKISSCRACGTGNLKDFFDLGSQPLANSLLNQPNEKEKTYPLSLSWCGACHLVQLNHTVDPKILFSSYVWVTGTSKTATDYAERFYAEVVNRIERPRDGYVLEVASNDGTFLKPFKRAGHAVLGIDPAENIAREANAVGIETECSFFGQVSAEDIVRRRGKARIVFARNVLPHVADTRDFVHGIRLALADNGLGVIEVHYAKIILDELHYDSIYHEHLCYFTLKSLERLLNNNGLFVFDLMKSPISGGSIVVFVSKEKRPTRPIVKKYYEIEARERINNLARWQEFADAAHAHRAELLRLVNEAKSKGGVVVGYGASARSSTLLNFCGVDYSLISMIADRNPLKQGLYTAGTHIHIESPEKVFALKPSHVLILAWNFEAEIKEYLAEAFGFRKSFIIPLPGMPRFE